MNRRLPLCQDESFTTAPSIGQNTDAVLAEILGYDEARIVTFGDKGAIG